jgi:hypothetical protein
MVQYIIHIIIRASNHVHCKQKISAGVGSAREAAADCLLLPGSTPRKVRSTAYSRLEQQRTQRTPTHTI